MPPELAQQIVPSVDDLLALAVAALGGQRRDGQAQMAQVVADAIDGGTHLFVQAGTGTGKSLGYLVPAVRHAVVDGGRVVVATATLALQRQLMTRDLPDLCRALAAALPAQPTFALLKGRNNYVCRYKLGGGFPLDEQDGLFDLISGSPAVADHPQRPFAGTFAADVRRAREWAEETQTGDRDDLVPGVSERAWRQISVVAAECLGGNCPMFGDCFVEQAKGAAAEADVVVTNHAMLALDAAGHSLIPEHDVLIIDEGHELTDRVTTAVSGSLTEAVLETTGRIVRRALALATDDLDAAAKGMAGVLADLPAGRLPQGLPPAVAAALGQVATAARTLVSAAKQDGAGPAEGARQQALAAVQDVLVLADRFVAAGDGDIVWVERPEDESTSRIALHIAPLSVAELLRTTVLADATTVLTSATLALGQSFETAARAVGLAADERVDAARGTGDGVRWFGIDVGSPFDYPRQGILYIAARLPRPGRDGLSDEQLGELTALIRAAGGRTLGLFSSHRAARLAADVLRERVSMPIIVQGEDGLSALVRRFAEEPETCLFGTLSLWQGVDVPGPSCQLVTIDRLPFPRPDDPVRSARSAAADAAGRNGFMTVAAAHAALLLAQGAGRLIRHADDRGVVAVLDSRLSNARYGGFLRRSLPPLWPTTDLAVATAALERLRTQPGLQGAQH